MIVDERLTIFIDSLNWQLPEYLKEVERRALYQEVPIVRRSMQSLLAFLMRERQPQKLLEIGTAVGFSGMLLCEYAGQGARLDTIEKVPQRIRAAKENFARYQKEGQITLWEGDAAGLSIQNDSMENGEFYTFLYNSFQNMVEHLESGGAAYVFHADTEGLNFRKAFVDAGFHLAGVCIWVKNSLVLGRSDYQWQHEPVLYGFLKNGKHPWYSDRKQTTIWNYDKPKRNKNHPTSKPLDLLGYPICNSSQENAIVLDTFGGSGSTMMACEQTNRICHMMELDEKYASVILRRYVEDTGDSENVYVVRGGEKIPYSALVKEVEME